MIINPITKKTVLEFKWYNQPKYWRVDSGRLTIKPNSGTDIIRSYQSTIADNASFLYTPYQGDFCLQAKVSCTLADKFDAGALMIRQDESHWAKLCIEQCADSTVSIVSVVTNEWSDDSNNEQLNSSDCHLRIIRKDNMIVFHYSLDGIYWRFVRKFAVNWSKELHIGFAAQAPFACGSEVIFEKMHLDENKVTNFRNGE